MIPSTIAPVLIPPVASPRSADFNCFVAMIHILFFRLLGQVAVDQPRLPVTPSLKGVSAA
jgi:hypothetical protein